ncbi:MAG: hypothetical protein HZA50_00805 [Planctomycetes bacterium]|nr:hypothetical protein [Planctomycetota bacterium]
MEQIWSICKNTFIQTIRQPIYGLLIFITIAALVLSLPVTGSTLDPNVEDVDQRMLSSLSLSTLLGSAFLIAIFGASWGITRELEDRTALTVVSKPVSRAVFIIGKFAGLLLAVLVSYYICSLVFLMTIRHGTMPTASHVYDMPVIVFGMAALLGSPILAGAGNYFFGWSFNSALVWLDMILFTLAMGLVSFIGKFWTIVPFGCDVSTELTIVQVIKPDLILAMYNLLLAAIILTALAVAVSSRLGQIPTLLVCLVLLYAGSSHDYLFSKHAGQFVSLWLLGWLLPNLADFYPIDALVSGAQSLGAITATAAGVQVKLFWLQTLYAILYSAGAIFAAIGLFQRRQLDSDEGVGGIPGWVSIVAWTFRIAAIACLFAGFEAFAGICADVVSNWFGGDFTPKMAIMLNLLITGHAGETRYDYAFLPATGLLAAGAGLWLLSGFFARAAKWSYWTIMALFAAGIIFQIILYARNLDGINYVADGAKLAVNAFLILCLVMPRSRHYFFRSVT